MKNDATPAEYFKTETAAPPLAPPITHITSDVVGYPVTHIGRLQNFTEFYTLPWRY